jgi:ABC-type ATPase with predicted acetyltransferase domain
MTLYTIDKKFNWQPAVTAKVESVLKMFGLDIDSLSEASPHHNCTIEINPGQIIFITGPSGAGKSVLLRELLASVCHCGQSEAISSVKMRLPRRCACRNDTGTGHESRVPSHVINLDSIKLSKNRAVIDCIDGNFVEALKTLSIAGLSDVFAVLNTPANLSDGQKYRFKLAKAFSLLCRDAKSCVSSESRATGPVIFADEFCSTLDRITASVIAFQIRKFATRHNIAFVLASAHQDLLADLQPDILIIKHLNSKTEVIHKNHEP